MNLDARWGRHGAVLIAHRPGTVPGDAVVAVAGELAADAADRVPDRQPGRRHVEERQVEQPAPACPQQHPDRAADATAEPDQARAGEEVGEPVVGWVLDDEVDLGADDAADQPGEDHLVGPIDRLVELPKALADENARGDEPEREHDPEGLQGDGAYFDFRLHGQ